MHGESPKTLPVTFKKTKYLMIEERMHTLIHDREEALAAHELAIRRIADRRKNTSIPFKKRRSSLVRHKEYQNNK